MELFWKKRQINLLNSIVTQKRALLTSLTSKKDGSTRFSRGTLNPKLALKEKAITKDELFDFEEQFNLSKLQDNEIDLFVSPTSKKHLHYIDVTAGGVRQMDPNTLIY